MAHRIEIGRRVPRRRFGLLRPIGRAVLALGGWTVDVRFPDAPKLVVIAAPHTSNWDFVWGIAAIFLLELDIHWYAKHTLFAGIWGRLFRAVGGVPVDRRAPGGIVEETARAFAAREQLLIAIAP